MIGPILELSGVKMHISKGYKTTTEFSAKLARAAGVQDGHSVLDVFFGQGKFLVSAILRLCFVCVCLLCVQARSAHCVFVRICMRVRVC